MASRAARSTRARGSSRRSRENVGAGVMGRNMFGPIGGGDWGDGQWKGWWGDDPPYHNDVFVLTHHPREPVEMEGGTTYHFVTDGIERALERAKESADGQDVVLWGGAQIINAVPGGGARWTSSSSTSFRCCSGAALASSTTSGAPRSSSSRSGRSRRPASRTSSTGWCVADRRRGDRRDHLIEMMREHAEPQDAGRAA